MSEIYNDSTDTFERLENGCYILKQKDYEELVKRAAVKPAREIRVNWGWSNYSYDALAITGDFILSNNLTEQIRRIIVEINTKLDTKVSVMQSRGFYCGMNSARQQFANLPWYKRLFFRNGYIQ